jgi:trigger factor
VEVNVEQPGNSLAKVRFSVPQAEFEKEVQRGLKQMGSQTRMKGFRPGKVPAHVLEKQHGTEVRNEVRQHFIRKAYQEAVEGEGLKPMAHPRVNLDDMLEETGDFTVEFEISLRPEVVVDGYKGQEIESELEPIMDQEVDNAIDEVKTQQSTPEAAGDEGIAENGMVLCDVAFVHEDKAHFEREGLRLSPITPPPGIDPEQFKEALVGAKDEDVMEVEMTLPMDLEDEAVRGQQGTCKITVKQAFNMVPPADEKLFEMFEVEDLAALKTSVREKIGEAKEQRETSRLESELLNKVIEATEIDLPGPMLDQQTDARLSQLHSQMSEQGVEPDKIHEAVEEQRPTARIEAEKGLKALMIVEAIAEKEELLVNDADLEAEIAQIAERNKATIEEVRKYYVENNMGQQMAIEILERKVRTFLRENAKIKQPS